MIFISFFTCLKTKVALDQETDQEKKKERVFFFFLTAKNKEKNDIDICIIDEGT